MGNFEKIMKKNKANMDKMHEKRIERCVPVARELIKIIAKHADTMPLGDVQQFDEGYHPIILEILQNFLDNDVHLSDREFILSLVAQAFSFPCEGVKSSHEQQWQTAISGLFGKNAFELTYCDFDAALKKGLDVDEKNETSVS